MDSPRSPNTDKPSLISLILTDAALVLFAFCAASFAAWQIDAWQNPQENAPHKIDSSQSSDQRVYSQLKGSEQTLGMQNRAFNDDHASAGSVLIVQSKDSQ
ncbi:hypothetical protein [Pseudomonas sp. S1(2024)]|uniref:hypothetical protein n=1 Tax=Pseudomonas sp. S1(2024) TaxID=3390191 RepID=UPI00397DB90C